MNKIQVAVIFGGISSEHEISLLSAGNIMRSIPRDKYDVLPIGITKDGRWLYCPDAINGIENGRWKEDVSAVAAVFSPDASLGGFIANGKTMRVDVAFPVLHGKGGEDGTIQGLFTMAKIPYVGCGVLSSALCMDKIVANRVMDACGIPRCEWMGITKADLPRLDAIETRAQNALGYPMFIKPSNAGSSVGVSKVNNKVELESAVTLAFNHDSRVIFERYVKGREVECAVMGNENAFASEPGEVLSSKEFYDYEDKYFTGMSRTQIPANLPRETLDEIRQTAIFAYKSLACEGLARVDFFIEDASGRVLLNEINTMPGFTAISMYPKMLQATGLTYAEICAKLIDLALEKGV